MVGSVCEVEGPRDSLEESKSDSVGDANANLVDSGVGVTVTVTVLVKPLTS